MAYGFVKMVRPVNFFIECMFALFIALFMRHDTGAYGTARQTLRHFVPLFYLNTH